MRPLRAMGALVLVGIVLAVPASADASPAKVAALQSALQALRLYDGFVDGVRGPLTRQAVVSLQRRRGLSVDGVAGPQTRRALGWRGRPGLGSRAMQIGDKGWDVAALQFLLQRSGHGAGRADGLFGPLTQAAVTEAQSAIGIAADGVAGPQTLRSLRGGRVTSTPVSNPTGPVRFLRPVDAPIADGFGAPRSDHVHQGLDFPAAEGTVVTAAGVGTTIFAGYNSGGFGNLVVVQHRLGYTSWYAHLSRITSWVGEQVEGGTRIGYVGSTGNSTGPHLHFEVRRYDTPIDPEPLLVSASYARASGRSPAPSASGSKKLECTGPERDKRKPAPGGDWIGHERLCPPG